MFDKCTFFKMYNTCESFIYENVSCGPEQIVETVSCDCVAVARRIDSIANRLNSEVIPEEVDIALTEPTFIWIVSKHFLHGLYVAKSVRLLPRLR